MSTPAPHPSPGPLLDALEGFLQDRLAELPPPPLPRSGRGRPALLAVCTLWTGLLVCVLRGFTAQRHLWQQLCLHGLWHFPRVAITEQAIYQRLATLDPSPFLTCFAQLTTLLRDRYAAVNDVPYAPFASEILALDHSQLDPVLRKLKLLRGLPPGDRTLIPGQLATLFDVRRQLFYRAEFWEEAARSEQHDVLHWLEHVPAGTLLLFDQGFNGFRWLDAVTEASCHFVTRLRPKTSYQVQATLYDAPAGPVHLRDQWIYLGAHRADRAAHPLRRIEIHTPTATYCYLTNVLDPELLSAADVQALYRRRWDLEQAFNVLKSHLNLFLLWSGHARVVQLQVLVTLVLAQVVAALRLEVAQGAGAEVREVSLPQLLRWLPELARTAPDPLGLIIERGRLAGLIRPFRGREYALPQPQRGEYAVPTERPPPRKPRYAGKKRSRKVAASGPKTPRTQRTRTWGQRARRVAAR